MLIKPRMYVLVVSAIVVILLAAGLLLYRHYFLSWKSRKLAETKYALVKPLLDKLANKQTISADDVKTLANDPSLRVVVFRILEEAGRTDLFPAEHLTKAKGAEGFMVNWLEYPTELGRAPNEIELLETVLHAGDTELEYFVFMFRTLPPHWAARKSWMMGISGPYGVLTTAYDVPLRVFSRFNKVGSLAASLEVNWVHMNINPA